VDVPTGELKPTFKEKERAIDRYHGDYNTPPFWWRMSPATLWSKKSDTNGGIMWMQLETHENCTYVDEKEWKCWHYAEDKNMLTGKSVSLTCDADDSWVPYGKDENPWIGYSWCWVKDDYSCVPTYDHFRIGYKVGFGTNNAWYINTELSNFEDRGNYNGKVPCPNKTEDGRCWFWVPPSKEDKIHGHKPRPECCPSSFNLVRYTTNIWDPNAT